jgi:hypothetical protein
VVCSLCLIFRPHKHTYIICNSFCLDILCCFLFTSTSVLVCWLYPLQVNRITSAPIDHNLFPSLFLSVCLFLLCLLLPLRIYQPCLININFSFSSSIILIFVTSTERKIKTPLLVSFVFVFLYFVSSYG